MEGRGVEGGVRGGRSCGERIDFANLQLWFPQSVLSLVHSDEQKTGLGTSNAETDTLKIRSKRKHYLCRFAHNFQ